MIDYGFSSPIADEVHGGSMSAPPEQHAGAIHGSVTPDVFATATVLTSLLTGQYATGPVGAAAATQWRAHAAKVDVRAGGVPLRDVLAKALHEDPARRYQSAQEFLDALRPFGAL